MNGDQTLNDTRGLGDPDQARVAQTEADLDTVFRVYDGILVERKYLTSDGLSLVDLFYLPDGTASKMFGHAGMFAKYPNVDR